MDNKILGIVASALQLDADEFITSLKEGEAWLPESQFSEKFSQTIKGQISTARDQQHKRGLKEAHAAVAKRLKNLGFENPDNLTGDEFWAAFGDWATAGKADPATLDEAAVSKLPSVKKLILTAKQEAAAAAQNANNELALKVKAFEQKEFDALANASVLDALTKAKVQIGTDALTSNQRAAAVRALLPYPFVFKENKPVFVGADGEPETDEFGKPLSFEKKVSEIGVLLFGVGQTGKGAPPPKTGGGEGGGGSTKYTFKDAADFNLQFNRELNYAKKIEMAESWEAQNK